MHSIRFLIILALLLFQSSAFSAVNAEYLEALITKSKQLGLADRPEWQKLMHYVPNLIYPGVHGMVDSQNFYNSPDGKNNPQLELEATLENFYSDLAESNEQQNPQCLFVARYAWLDEQLAFDPQRLPRQVCKRYQQWHASLNPSGLTLIFASAYLNSPSSMYGHPLVRVDAKSQDENTRLLAYAITFAANTNEENGLAFAVNGLFGGYPGAFSILPYYLKVREYSNLENRDIWEYELNFTPEETDRILMHAWELGSTYFQYYFFDENCAYHLLGLLQVARPNLNLTNQFRWWVIPTDSVREITRQKNIVKKVVYRPANSTVVKHRLNQLSKSERNLVRDLSMSHMSVNDLELEDLPANRKAAVLETSQDYVTYRRAIGKNDMAEPATIMNNLLTARSRLSTETPFPKIIAPLISPEQGHGSSRVALATGHEDGLSFQELNARATYHDIMDTDDGYARGAQIEFFNLALRRYKFDTTRVEKFIPINILSLTPRDDFFKSKSWKIKAGWQRIRAANGTRPLAFSLDGGTGGSWSNERETTLWYILLDGSARINRNLENGYSLGGGVSMGDLFDVNQRWRIHGYLYGMRYVMGQRDSPQALGLEQRLALGRNFALRLDFARNRELERSYNSGLFSLLYYF